MSDNSGDQLFLATIAAGGGDLPRSAVDELRKQLQAYHIERSGQSRIFFRTTLPATRFLSLCAPEKIYAVVLRMPSGSVVLPHGEEEAALASLVASSEGWASVLRLWREVAGDPVTFRVSGKRAGSRGMPSSNGIAEAVGEAMMSFGWRVDLKTFDMEIVVHLNDDALLVMVPVLERPSLRQTGPVCPGLTQPVAWAMGCSLNVEPGDVVVDPMCGSGIILLEAVQCWRATYLGFDNDISQLERSQANLELMSARLRCTVSLGLASATRLPLSSASVDKIVCDLPFGKMFGSEAENETLYPAVVAEFARVLRAAGKVVLLTNMANAERLGDALCTELWTPTCRRRLLLGKMEAVLFLASRALPGASKPTLPAETMRLPWEDGSGRHTWRAQKAMAREPLQFVTRRTSVG